MLITKLCKRCNTVKPIDQFPLDPRYAMGRFCWCKDCKHFYDKVGDATRWKRRGKV